MSLTCLRAVRAVRPAVGFVCLALLLAAVLDLQLHARHAPQVATPATPDVTVLDADKIIERELARGQEHLYRLTLKAGEYASVIVEQRGIDAIVQARGPDGKVIADFQEDVRKEGQEQVEIVADTAGTYTLSVTAALGTFASDASYSIRVASQRPATEADRSVQQARTLRVSAAALELAGKGEEARPLYERALALSEAARGPDDLYVITLVRDLAGNAMLGTHDAVALPLLQRALVALQKAFGDEHPETAMVQARLAIIYAHMGQRPRADAVLRRSLEILEKTVGTDHRYYVRALVTQGNLRQDGGDLDKAEEIERRALAIMERIGDDNSVTYAGVLNNLGDVLRQRQDYVHAGELLRRSLALGEQLRGPDSLFVATELMNLGILAREQKDYATALSHYARALAIRERALGADHPEVASLLINQANVQSEIGDIPKSLETLLHALSIMEKTSGGYGRGTLVAVGNIARRYATIGDIPNAIAFQQRADSIIEKQLGLDLAIGSERQKQVFVNSMSERTDRTISLSLTEAAGNPDAIALAATVLLQRKGRVLDAMIDTFAIVRQHIVDPKDRELLDELNATTSRLAEVALTLPATAKIEERQSQLKELEAKKEQLEVELSEHSAVVRARLRPVTLEAVQAVLPDDAALVEFAVFRPFNTHVERNADAYAPAHYAAYVVRKHAMPIAFDLGPAKEIDEAIETLRQALRDPTRTDLKKLARALDDQVMRPIRASFGTATRLLISPDGDLNLVPVEALVDEHGHYLIERYAISYLTSGRDLLRAQTPDHAALGPPVVIADPFFGEPTAVPVSQSAQAQAQAEAPRTPSQVQTRGATRTARTAGTGRRSVTVAQDLSTVYFAPLAGTAEEARTIKTLFPDPMLLTGARATKATLKGLAAPSMLHIASHGFFLEDASHAADAPAPGAPTPAATGGATRAMSASVKVENPLLRSGLALAGANLRRDPHDDGILTALEASGLNLWGTKLVTLSACDTGVGEVRNGEGVYGLRRALVLAGAETLVMSLWPVSDYMTRQMMTSYYTGLRAGLGRGDALRQAKLAMLKKADRQHRARHPYQHPFYWASFIQSGEWTSLDEVH